MGDSLQEDARRSRRAVLAAAAGGAAALAVHALRPSAIEAAATNMQTETDNPTAAPTGVSNSTADSDALFGNATGDGAGIKGTSVVGIGVLGTSADTSDPASNTRNAGVVGVAGSMDSVTSNLSLTGVYGYTDPSTVEGLIGAGVWGDSPDIGTAGTGGVGVFGYGLDGVVGVAATAASVGVLATADDAAARSLRVEGRAEFTRSGRATVKAGNAKKTVSLARCTASTLVLAVLAANRSGRYVRAVVPASGSFTLYLNNSVTKDTPVTWIAFTNPSNHSG
jgi:hypothetical protein